MDVVIFMARIILEPLRIDLLKLLLLVVSVHTY